MSHQFFAHAVFRDLDSIRRAIRDLENETNSQWAIIDSKRFSDQDVSIPVEVKERLVYKRLTYVCYHYRNNKNKLAGVPKTEMSQYRCNAVIKLINSRSEAIENMLCTQADLEHTCPMEARVLQTNKPSKPAAHRTVDEPLVPKNCANAPPRRFNQANRVSSAKRPKLSNSMVPIKAEKNQGYQHLSKLTNSGNFSETIENKEQATSQSDDAMLSDAEPVDDGVLDLSVKPTSNTSSLDEDEPLISMVRGEAVDEDNGQPLNLTLPASNRKRPLSGSSSPTITPTGSQMPTPAECGLAFGTDYKSFDEVWNLMKMMETKTGTTWRIIDSKKLPEDQHDNPIVYRHAFFSCQRFRRHNKLTCQATIRFRANQGMTRLMVTNANFDHNHSPSPSGATTPDKTANSKNFKPGNQSSRKSKLPPQTGPTSSTGVVSNADTAMSCSTIITPNQSWSSYEDFKTSLYELEHSTGTRWKVGDSRRIRDDASDPTRIMYQRLVLVCSRHAMADKKKQREFDAETDQAPIGCSVRWAGGCEGLIRVNQQKDRLVCTFAHLKHNHPPLEDSEFNASCTNHAPTKRKSKATLWECNKNAPIASNASTAADKQGTVYKNRSATMDRSKFAKNDRKNEPPSLNLETMKSLSLQNPLNAMHLVSVMDIATDAALKLLFNQLDLMNQCHIDRFSLHSANTRVKVEPSGQTFSVSSNNTCTCGFPGIFQLPCCHILAMRRAKDRQLVTRGDIEIAPRWHLAPDIENRSPSPALSPQNRPEDNGEATSPVTAMDPMQTLTAVLHALRQRVGFDNITTGPTDEGEHTEPVDPDDISPPPVSPPPIDNSDRLVGDLGNEFVNSIDMDSLLARVNEKLDEDASSEHVAPPQNTRERMSSVILLLSEMAAHLCSLDSQTNFEGWYSGMETFLEPLARKQTFSATIRKSVNRPCVTADTPPVSSDE